MSVLPGCPDPVGEFEEFSEALAKKPLPPAGDCGAQVTDAVQGVFFAAFATQLARQNPVVMRADITTDEAGMLVTLQPLRVDDRTTPDGAPIVAAPAPIDATGHFEVTLIDVVLSSGANPITSDEIVAPSLVLSGTACEALLCGDLSGEITSPLPLTLEAGKSQFAMQRVADGEPYPEPPLINCAGELAKPLD